MFRKPLIAVALASACSTLLAADESSLVDSNAIESIVITYSERDSLADLTNGGFVEVIDRTMIEELQAQSVGELLSKLPSVSSFDLSGNGLEPVIGLRGFGETASQNTLVTLNGIPINPATNEGPVLGAISLEAIERIEVRPRASTVLHGGGAVAGVINLVTRAKPGSSATVEVGDFGKEKISVSSEVSDLSITATIHNVDGYRRNTDEQSISVSFHNLYSGAYANHQIFGHFDKADRGFLSGSTLETLTSDPRGGTTADRNERDYIFVGYKLQFPNTDASIGTFQSDQEGTVNGNTRFAQSTMSLRGNVERKIWSIDTVYGLEIQYDDSKFHSPDGVAAFSTSKSEGEQIVSSLYGKRDFPIDAQTKATIGGRYSHLNVDVFQRDHGTGSPVDTNLKTDQTASSFEASITRQLSQRTTLSLSASQSVRFATINEQQTNAMLPQALKPQIGRGIDLGVSYYLSSAEVTADIYYLRLSDEIGYVDNPGFSNDGNFNIDESLRKGLNLAANLELSQSTDMTISTSLIDAKATTGAQADKRLPLISNRSAETSLTQQLDSGWQARISYLYESDKILGSDWNNEGTRMPSQSKSDFFLEKSFDQINIKLGINNLFDQTFYTYGVRGFSTRVGPAGFYDFFIPSDPRTLQLSLQARF